MRAMHVAMMNDATLIGTEAILGTSVEFYP